MKALFLSFTLLLLSFSAAWCTDYSTLNLANPLGSLGQSARASAMGSAFTAVTGDTADLDWNPAGLSETPSAQISLNHDSWLTGVFQEQLALAVPLPRAGVLALASSYVNDGNLSGYDSTGTPTGTYQPSRIAAELAWGGRIFEGVSIGAEMGGYRQSIGQNTYDSFFLSLGGLWSPVPFLRVGISYSGLGILLNGFSASGVLRTGLAWSFRESKGPPALLTMDLFMPPYGVYRAQLGLEKPVLSDFFLRAGYQFDLVDNQIPGFQSLAAGLGFRLGDLELDYAYLPMGDLGSTQRLGLTYRFGETAKTAATPVPKSNGNQAAPPTDESNVTPTPTAEKPTLFRVSPNANPMDAVEKIELQFSLPVDPSEKISASSPSPELLAAVDRYEKYLQSTPLDSHAWQILGQLYYNEGRKAEAVQCLEQSLRLAPDNPPLREWLLKYKALNP